MQRTKESLAGLCMVVIVLIGLLPSHTARAASGREPVIVIPGVAGSEFTARNSFRLSVENGRGGTYTRDYKAGEKVWVNIGQAAAFGEDDYFDVLKLQRDATTPVAPALYVSGIYQDAYGDLVKYLERQGYKQGLDLWIFPYDWRRDIRATNSQLDELITQALIAVNGQTDPAQWAIKRADIVGHSMGGLVGRSYIADTGRANRVDQLITLGSPQLGATKFLKTLVYGDSFGPYFLGIGLNPNETKDVVQNMPGGFQLLPSRAYYTFYDNSDTRRLRPWIEDRDIDGDGAVKGALSYTDAAQLLLNLDKNRTGLNLAETFHDPLDGQRNGGVNGVRWAALVGYGYGTPGQIREYIGSCLTWSGYKVCDKRDETPVDGDGTVAVLSAAMGDPQRNTFLDTGAQLWYIEREHGDLVKRNYVLGIPTGDGPALEWIGGLLRGTIPMSATAQDGEKQAQEQLERLGIQATPYQPKRSMWVSALGPVALKLQSDTGATIGRESGVHDALPDAAPDARYERLPGAEFAALGSDSPYTLDMAAEAEGSVDVKVRILGANGIEQTALYLGVRLSATGKTSLALPQSSRLTAPLAAWPDLRVDAEGDGIFEAAVPPTAILDARASADTTAPDLTITAPTDSATPGSVTIQWQARDQLSGLLLEQAQIITGSAAPRTVANGETVTLAPGPHRLVVLAQDRAGNAVSREVAFNVEVSAGRQVYVPMMTR